MVKETMLTELLGSRFLTTVWPYVVFIILSVASLQLLRLVISIVLTILRLLVRIVLLAISWPVYLILLPARALVFFTKLTVKVIFYVAIAAILYRLLGGALNSEMIKETFDGLLQYVQATFLQQ